LPDFSHLIEKDGQSPVSLALKHLLFHPLDLGAMLKIFNQTKKVKPVLQQCYEHICNALIVK
jgi:hypothetical protein